MCTNANLILLLVGFPHIHGVAWIAEQWLNNNGFKDTLLSDAKEEAVTKLANLLISCQLPEPGPEPGPDASLDEIIDMPVIKCSRKLFL